MNALNVSKIRNDFPILATQMNGKPLVYLDNAASTHKPQEVINRISQFYSKEYANIHRGVYSFSQIATEFCDQARVKVQKFIGAADSSEIVFVRGATEAINLVAATYGKKFLKKDDEILISEVEHHANLVPWQMLCEEKGLKLKVIPVNDKGEIDIDAYQALLGPRVYLVAITQVSNALGSIFPVKEMIKRAHHAGAVVLVDGAQAVPHMKVNVVDLDADFYVFSGHKVYGPTGVGVLYGKKKHLEAMPPYQGGGDMIENVTFEKTTYAKPPARFEAGTPAIAEIIGLGAALDYLSTIGLESIQNYEKELLDYATKKLSGVKDLKIIGTAYDKASLVSFVISDVHPHDIGTVLDQHGIAVRAGHHCAQPTMKRFKVPATTRASFSFYNTKEEIDVLVEALESVAKIFK